MNKLQQISASPILFHELKLAFIALMMLFLVTSSDYFFKLAQHHAVHFTEIHMLKATFSAVFICSCESQQAH